MKKCRNKLDKSAWKIRKVCLKVYEFTKEGRSFIIRWAENYREVSTLGRVQQNKFSIRVWHLGLCLRAFYFHPECRQETNKKFFNSRQRQITSSILGRPQYWFGNTSQNLTQQIYRGQEEEKEEGWTVWKDSVDKLFSFYSIFLFSEVDGACVCVSVCVCWKGKRKPEIGWAQRRAGGILIFIDSQVKGILWVQYTLLSLFNKTGTKISLFIDFFLFIYFI